MYDKPYFYRRRISKYDPYQIMIAAVWFAAFRPPRVFDLGCGIGSYLFGFSRLGCMIGGCDIGWEAAKPFMRGTIRRKTFPADVGQPIKVGRRFDLVLCLDVAEHVSQDRHGTLWDNIKRLGKRWVLFSGGLPSQPGCGHIACQTRDKWIQDGKDAGLVYDEPATAQALLALNSLGDPLDFMNRLICFKVPT